MNRRIHIVIAIASFVVGGLVSRQFLSKKSDIAIPVNQPATSEPLTAPSLGSEHPSTELLTLRATVASLLAENALLRTKLSNITASTVRHHYSADPVVHPETAELIVDHKNTRNMGYSDPQSLAATWINALITENAKDSAKASGSKVEVIEDGWSKSMKEADHWSVSKPTVGPNGDNTVRIGYTLKNGLGVEGWLRAVQNPDGSWKIKSIIGYPISVIGSPQ